MRTTLFLFSIALFLFSCDNGELSKKKAAKLIDKCDSNLRSVKVTSFYKGLIDFSKKPSSLKSKYDQLEKDGAITITEKEGKFLVDLTEKGRNYIADKKFISETGDGFMDAFYGKSKNKVYVVSSRYLINEVLEIQEIPQANVAMVKATYKRSEETPFFSFEEDTISLTRPKNMEFRKTTDGWKFCKSFKPL